MEQFIKQKNYELIKMLPSNSEYITFFKAIKNDIITQDPIVIMVIDYSKISPDNSRQVKNLIFIQGNSFSKNILIDKFKSILILTPIQLLILKNMSIHFIRKTYSNNSLFIRRIMHVFQLIQYHNQETLREKFQNDSYPSQKRAMLYLEQLVDGLLYVQQQKKMAHLDLCPENISLIQGIQGEVLKIAEFGLKKGQDYKIKIHKKQNNYHYQSSEYYDPDAIPEKVDVWSLGIITYEMLFEKVPYEGDNFEKLQLAMQQKQFKSEDFNQKLLFNSVKQLLADMLKFNYKERISLKEVYEQVIQINKDIENELFKGNLYKLAILKSIQDELKENNKLKETYGYNFIQKIEQNLRYHDNKIRMNLKIQHYQIAGIQMIPNIEQIFLIHLKKVDSESLFLIAQIIDIQQYDLLNKKYYKMELEEYFNQIEELQQQNKLRNYVRNRILKISN